MDFVSHVSQFTGDIAGFFDSSLHYLNTNAYPEFSPPDDTGVLGVMFSPMGKVLVVPLGDSIELWDAAQGTLRARLMTPEKLHVLVYPEGPVAPMLALDATGQAIYAISSSGLTVLKLPATLDQMPAMQWPLAVRPGAQQTRLHGSITTRMAAIRSKPRK
jgi:WD40 repeat protein